MPQSRLTLLAPLGLELARRLTDLSLGLEGLPRREMPEIGVFAVGDQIALAAHDLAAALAAEGSDSGSGSEAEAEAVLAEALRLVAELAQRLATTRSARM